MKNIIKRCCKITSGAESKNVARLLLEQLAQWGVDTVYGVVGDSIIYLLDEMARFKQIQFVSTRHEEAAALMAAAHAKLTGKLGVCTATAGPGAAHLINGLADAASDRVPVLAITGQVESFYIGTWHKQYTDLVGLMRPFSLYSTQLAAADAVIPVTVKAMRTSLAGQGVTHISIPKDMFAVPAKGAVHPPEPYLQTPSQSSGDVLREALPLLRQAKRPAILFGRGCLEIGDLLVHFAEHVEGALIHTLPATGVVADNHPLNVGGLGKAGRESAAQILSQADLCIKIGATWWPAGYVPQNIPILQIDARAEHLGGAVPIAYGIVGDGAAVLSQLTAALPKAKRAAWRQTITEAKQASLKANDFSKPTSNNPIQPQRIMQVLSDKLAPDAIVSLDVGDHTIWFARNFQAKNQRVLVSGKWRTMGCGLPYALAAQRLHPGRQVVCLTGDGGFMMTDSEMTTARENRLPVKVFVFRNHTLATEENRMKAGGLLPLGCSFAPPDFAAMAKANGWLGLSVEREEHLSTAIDEALSAEGPALVDMATANPVPPGTKI